MSSPDESRPRRWRAMVVTTVAGLAALAAALGTALRHEDVAQTLRSAVIGVAFLHLGYSHAVDLPTTGGRRRAALANDTLIWVAVLTVAVWSFF